SRRDPLLDEGVPVMAMRALPQELRAAVAAAHADVWIEIEDGMFGELAVAVHERCRMVERGQRAPDRLVDAQRVWILNERGEQQVQGVRWPAACGEVTGQREPRAPVLRSVVDEPAAESCEPIRIAGTDGQRLEPIERQIRAVGRDLDDALP